MKYLQLWSNLTQALQAILILKKKISTLQNIWNFIQFLHFYHSSLVLVSFWISFFLRLTKDRNLSRQSTDYNERAKRFMAKNEIIEPTLHNILLEQILDLVVKKTKKNNQNLCIWLKLSLKMKTWTRKECWREDLSGMQARGCPSRCQKLHRVVQV